METIESTLGGLLPGGKYLLLVMGGAMAIEMLAGWLNHEETHDLGETLASLVIGIGYKFIAVATAGLSAIPLAAAYQFRLFTIPAGDPLALAVLFVLTDFFYYWHHFAMHKVRWFWATHSVHHSARKLNLTATVRLGWGGQLTGGVLFYLPLALLGFHPYAILAMLALGVSYQFLLHPAHPPSLGPLEWLFNTPRHHHVHHASNEACLDRNFGGVFIVWDRLFGTFAEAPKGEALRYGLKGDESSSRNPLAVLTAEWGRMLEELWRARSPGEAWRALVGRKASSAKAPLLLPPPGSRERIDHQ